MKKSIKKVVTAALVFAMAVSCMTGCGKKNYRSVVVDSANGSSYVERGNDSIDAYEEMKLQPEDRVTVEKDSSLSLLVDADKHIAAEGNTVFTINAVGTEDAGKVEIKLVKGAALFAVDNKLNKDSEFEVTTRNATMSVRGTEFYVTYDKENNYTTLVVTDGVVHVEYKNGEEAEDVEAGEERYITEDSSEEEIPADIKISISGGLEAGGTAAGTGAFGEGETATGAYNYLIKNLDDYIAQNEDLTHEYNTRDFMLTDYDSDGEKELILRLQYRVDSEDYADYVITDFVPGVGVKTIVTELNQSMSGMIYAELKGELIKFMFSTKPYSSYIYYANLRDDRFVWVLESDYDHVLTEEEMEEMELKGLALHGEWELIFDDML